MGNCIIPGYKVKVKGFQTFSGRSLSHMCALHAAAVAASVAIRGRVGQRKQAGKKKK